MIKRTAAQPSRPSLRETQKAKQPDKDSGKRRAATHSKEKQQPPSKPASDQRADSSKSARTAHATLAAPLLGSGLAEGVGAAIGAAGAGVGFILNDYGETFSNGDGPTKSNDISSSSSGALSEEAEDISSNRRRIRKLLSEHDFSKVGPQGHDVQATRKAQDLGISMDGAEFETEILPLLKVQNLRILGEDPKAPEFEKWASDNHFVLKKVSDAYWEASHGDLVVGWYFGEDGERVKAEMRPRDNGDSPKKLPEGFAHVADFKTGALHLSHWGKSLQPQTTDPGERLIYPNDWRQGSFLSLEETLANMSKLSKKKMAHIELKRISSADYEQLGNNPTAAEKIFRKARYDIEHIITLHEKPNWGESQLTHRDDRGSILETFLFNHSNKAPRMSVEHIVFPPQS
jgi:hypothetical protein